MKETNSEIIDKIAGKGDGMTVPEGYFEDFALKMSSRLPFREELDKPVAQQTPAGNSRWLRVRPYFYMAAMFAGAWCLIKMFSLMSSAPSEVTIENYPSLSRALENEQFVDEYVIDDLSSYDVMEEYYYDETGEELDQEQTDAVEGDIAADQTVVEEPTYILPGSSTQENE